MPARLGCHTQAAAEASQRSLLFSIVDRLQVQIFWSAALGSAKQRYPLFVVEIIHQARFSKNTCFQVMKYIPLETLDWINAPHKRQKKKRLQWEGLTGAELRKVTSYQRVLYFFFTQHISPNTHSVSPKSHIGLVCVFPYYTRE